MNQGFPAGVGKSALAPRQIEANISGWKRVLRSWYAATAPADPDGKADFHGRENFRRGRLASLALLLVIFVVALYIAAIGITTNNNWPVYLSGGGAIFILVVVAGLLNRRGHLVASACTLMFILDGGIIAILLFMKGGLGLANLPVFDFLIGSELIAVSLLNPLAVFPVALLNSVLVVLIILFTHHSPDLDHYLGMNGLAVVLARPILLQFAVAVVTALWVGGVQHALKRADQAAMEYAIAEYERALAAQKRSLEHDIQYLVDTQRKVSSGDLTARVPITRDNVLWPVATSFNNLLTRFQHLQEDADQLQEIYREMPRLVKAIREAKRDRSPIVLPRGGTILDALVVELTENRPENPHG